MTSSRHDLPRILRLAILSAIAKGPGFLIPILIATIFGAGSTTDAYFLAYAGVLLVGGTVGQPLEAAIVPFAAHALALGRNASNRFMRALFRRGLVVGLSAAVLGAILLAAGLVVVQPLRVTTAQVLGFYFLLAPAAVAWCVAGIYTGSLASGWRLEIGALAYGFRGLGALCGALIGAAIHQLWPVAIGISAGEWVRVWWLRSHWQRVLVGIHDGLPGSPEAGFGGAALSQMTAQGVLSAEQLLERFLVGAVAIAAISHNEYAMRLIVVAAVVFDGGIAPWLLARWSTDRVRGELRETWAVVYQPLLISSVAALVIALVLFFGASTVVEAILHHGAFTAVDSLVVARVLRWYSIGYFFNMTALCIERLLLARSQNRLFAALAVLRASTRLVTVLLFIRSLDILALPLGYLVSEAIYVMSLLVVGRDKIAPSQLTVRS